MVIMHASFSDEIGRHIPMVTDHIVLYNSFHHRQLSDWSVRGKRYTLITIHTQCTTSKQYMYILRTIHPHFIA